MVYYILGILLLLAFVSGKKNPVTPTVEEEEEAVEVAATAALNVENEVKNNGKSPAVAAAIAATVASKSFSFHLKSLKNGNYCSVENDNSILCNKTRAGKWEKYELESTANDNVYNLKSLRNGNYCAVEDNNRILCNRTRAGTWEKYTMQPI